MFVIRGGGEEGDGEGEFGEFGEFSFAGDNAIPRDTDVSDSSNTSHEASPDDDALHIARYVF